jgi:hypothetical protein
MGMARAKDIEYSALSRSVNLFGRQGVIIGIKQTIQEPCVGVPEKQYGERAIARSHTFWRQGEQLATGAAYCRQLPREQFKKMLPQAGGEPSSPIYGLP